MLQSCVWTGRKQAHWRSQISLLLSSLESLLDSRRAQSWAQSLKGFYSQFPLKTLLPGFLHVISSPYQFKFNHFSSVIQSCPTLCDPMNRSTPGLPVDHRVPESTQTHVHLVSDAIQPSHPLSSPSPPAPNPSQHQGLFQWVNSSHEVAKVLEFHLQHQSLQWTPRTDLFRMDWLDLLAVQGTLKSLLQCHSSKASILRCSAFFTVQISHPYMTTGKTIALTRWTSVGEVMSLLFNMPSRLVITF